MRVNDYFNIIRNKKKPVRLKDDRFFEYYIKFLEHVTNRKLEYVVLNVYFANV